MAITIIGLGHVGISTAIGFAELNHKVYGVDIDKFKISSLKKRILPFFEEGVEEKLKIHLEKYFFPKENLEESFSKSSIFFICVDTPSDQNGIIDLTFVNNVAIQISELIKKENSYKIFVIKSTVVPGTTEKFGKIIESKSGKKANIDFGVAMFPEFLREGRGFYDFMNPNRIVIGVNAIKNKEILSDLFKDFNCPKFFTDIETAEFSKYASNAFLALKISFANELANLIDQFNLSNANRSVNIDDIIDIMGSDHRINPAFLRAGIGYGGSCFPKDVKALIEFAREIKSPMKLLETTNDVNNNQPKIVIKHLMDIVGDLNNKQIAILGLSFKPNTDNIRSAPSNILINELLKLNTIVHAWDPIAEKEMRKNYPNIVYHDSIADILNQCSSAIIVTEWPELKEYFAENPINIPVIDGRGIYPGATRSIGRSRL